LSKRKVKFIVRGAVVVFIVFIAYRIFYAFNNKCDIGFLLNRPETYFWLFDSAKRPSLKCEYALGNPSIGKFRFLYTYNKECKYFISQDSSLNRISLNNIKDTINHSYISESIISFAEVNDLYWGGRIYFSSKICTDSSHRILLCINSDDKITEVDSNNFKLFTGRIKNVVVQNDNNEPQYFIMYDSPKKTSLLFYKPKAILYFIIINDFEGSNTKIDGITNLDLK
jgi:hypothetical protein